MPFFNQSVLQHLFSIKGASKIIFVCNKIDFNDLDIQLNYLSEINSIPTEIIPIESHKRGPVFSLKEISAYLPDNNLIAVSYCDYYASDFGCFQFLDQINKFDDLAGSVLTLSLIHI